MIELNTVSNNLLKRHFCLLILHFIFFYKMRHNLSWLSLNFLDTPSLSLFSLLPLSHSCVVSRHLPFLFHGCVAISKSEREREERQAKGARGELSGNVKKRMRLPSAETRITIGGIGATRKRWRRWQLEMHRYVCTLRIRWYGQRWHTCRVAAKQLETHEIM